MKWKTIGCGIVMGLASLAVQAQTGDRHRGQLLYENHCRECHESIVHIREVRDARTLPEVHAAILRWAKVLNLEWSALEINDVLGYLNERYYKY